MGAIFCFLSYLSWGEGGGWGGEVYGEIILQKNSATKWVGEGRVLTQVKTKIRPGDLLETGKDAHLWLELQGGLMVRLWPYTRLIVREIVQGEDKIFYYLRLIDGLVNVVDLRHHRNEEKEHFFSDALFKNDIKNRSSAVHDNKENTKKTQVLLVGNALGLLVENPDILLYAPITQASEWIFRHGENIRWQLRKIGDMPKRLDLEDRPELGQWYKVPFSSGEWEKSSGKGVMDLYTRHLFALSSFMKSRKSSLEPIRGEVSQEKLELHIRFLWAYSYKNESIYLESLGEFWKQRGNKFSTPEAREYFGLPQQAYNFELLIE